MTNASDIKRRRAIFWGALVLLGVVYSAVVAPRFSIAYQDFGDGNYLYISSRMADGVVLYRDILAPQPPLHLFIGTLLIRLGRAIGDSPETSLYVVRGFSLILHLATMVLIALLARRIFHQGSGVWGLGSESLPDPITEGPSTDAGDEQSDTALQQQALSNNLAADSQTLNPRPQTPILAAGFSLIVPIGFWWTLAYQSEPLLMLFLLGGLLALLRWDGRGLLAAGVLHLLAILTNMTAVPYAGWCGLFLLVVDRRRFLQYTTPIIVGWLLVVGGFYLFNIDYLGNVFFNQVGTFAKKELNNGVGPLGYAFGKIQREGYDILMRDFFFILWASVGLVLYLRKPQQSSIVNRQSEIPRPSYERAFVAWFACWTWLSIGFLSKGGTMDYIFTIGEPLLVVFAAFAVITLIRRALAPRAGKNPGDRYFRVSALAVVLAASGYLQIFGYYTSDRLDLRRDDITNWPGLCTDLARASWPEAPGAAKKVWRRLPPELQPALEDAARGRRLNEAQETQLLEALNAIINQRGFFQTDDFTTGSIPENVVAILRERQPELSALETPRLNRFLLQSLFSRTLPQAQSRLFFGGQRMLLETLNEKTFEYPAAEIRRKVLPLIEQHTEPGDAILGPPFYAFITGRTLVEEYSEIYIWKMKYANEKIVYKQPGEGVAKVEKIAAALRRREIPLALMDSQLWGIPELRAALDEGRYRRLTEFRTLNTFIYVYVPEQADGRK